MKTLIILIILISSIFATTNTQNKCDLPFETFIKNREQENCKSIKIAALAFTQLQSLRCKLDDLDIDLGHYVLEQAKYCTD
jgi:hypothetical protein